MKNAEMKQRTFEFNSSVFGRVLGVILTLVLMGFAVSVVIYGRVALRDVVGALISAVIFAYTVHLWVLMARRAGSTDD